ncbi:MULTISPECIES: thiol-disulfide oxidoreductase DCC family protein [unclassified Rhizobium]|uniref:thiol-disulfide oxidoreductase DCC family protein n=1 Tax=unclassified Rhizobium TaxID=2613769 RepID=UPI0007F0C964|nr:MULTISPECIES: DUF393 domain-containing protein [unclassified Rhizobium]ANK88020.1 hypothetical protein AMK02_PB00092 [Rhizobium sp. N731]ANL18266.1 hypothetical protein AMJ97_PB00092 [Rhizobium sp. N1314]
MISPGFTDGNPIREFLIFVGILLVAFCVSMFFPAVFRGTALLAEKIANTVRRRNALPEHDLYADLRTLDLSRIIVGGLAAWRFGYIFLVATEGGDPFTLAIAGSATILSLLVAIGFATPIVSIVLMSSSNMLIDNFLGSSTLGTMVLAIVLALFVLGPAGRNFSMDSYLLGKGGWVARLIAAQNRFFGEPSADRLVIAKLGALLAYYCLCLYSVSWHLHDDAWRSGLIIAWVFLSPGSNPHFSTLAWSLYESWPWLFVNFSKLSILGMFIWYMAILPGLFVHTISRAFVILWGLAFFLVSAFVLPLSFLGFFELAFWFALFATGPAFGSRPQYPLSVMFDDRCNLCDRTVKTIATLDIYSRITFRPIRRNIEFAQSHGVTLERGLTDLVGVDQRNGDRYDGYALYETISRRIVLLWPVWPILLLGRITRVGPLVYRFIADRRTKIFGVCEFSNIPDEYINRPKNAEVFCNLQAFTPVICGVLITLVTMASLFVMRLPAFSTSADAGPPGRWSKDLVGSAPLGFGIGQINVFNAVDLALFKLEFSAFRRPVGSNGNTTSAITKTGSDPASPLFNLTDRQRYFIIRHARRMSRMNIGCDREFWDAVAPMYVEALVPEERVKTNESLVITAGIFTWPTRTELLNYTSSPRKFWRLCTAEISVDTGQVLQLQFDQAGVDEAARRNDWPPILEAPAIPAAIQYPCRADAGWLNTVVDLNASLVNSSSILRDARGLFEDRYGEFQLDCLFRAISFMKSDQALRTDVPQPDSRNLCEAGLALAPELVKAVEGVSELHGRFNVIAKNALDAHRAGKNGECTQAVAAMRRTYFEYILKPSGTLPLLSSHGLQGSIQETMVR